jgi:hypothetical protein
MAICPCCSDRLISQFRQGSLSLWCRSCYAEMPDLSEYRLAPVVALIPTQPRGLVSAAMQAIAVQKPPRVVNNIATIARRNPTESVA